MQKQADPDETVRGPRLRRARESGRPMKCPLCKCRRLELIAHDGFSICEDCSFRLDHEGRTRAEQESLDVARMNGRLDALERQVAELRPETEDPVKFDKDTNQ